ncbi:hypothetical protein [Lewinella sp. JB7]|uniref:hypothetical protein n=1 Tax=Lewinella sp. JB7 TaxID=2962887 RepID=UPI0020C99FA9|nr:hypothetical protein [Lewinella sp. JB7]MCP9235987.1 hypothetical protein [Lewinella sp. JB7]
MKALLYTLLFSALMFGSGTLTAQEYTSAIGIRLGSPIALSFKAFPFGDNLGIEAIVGYRNRDYFGYDFNQFNAGGLLQWHGAIGEVDGLRYYFGGGASAYVWSFDDGFGDSDYSDVRLGVHGNVGLDYVFSNAPVNLSLDFMPTLFIGEEIFDDSFNSQYALTARYILGD